MDVQCACIPQENVRQGMSQQIGIVQSFNDKGGFGFLSSVAIDPKSLPFKAIDVKGYGSLVTGEPVSSTSFGVGMVCMLKASRSMENLESYPDMGGLY